MALAVARRIVVKNGAAALSTRKIAADIGYTVESLYLVFRNINDLVLQLNAETLDEPYHGHRRRGLLRVSGRAKRFAKIGGEMVSLAAVEELAARVWPKSQHAVVAVPDRLKGEQLVLLTDCSEANRADLIARARTDGLGELHVPKRIGTVKVLPVLGTGKTDYVAARSPALQEVAG